MKLVDIPPGIVATGDIGARARTLPMNRSASRTGRVLLDGLAGRPLSPVPPTLPPYNGIGSLVLQPFGPPGCKPCLTRRRCCQQVGRRTTGEPGGLAAVIADRAP